MDGAEYVLLAAAVIVDLGETSRRYARGESLAGTPRGTLESLVRQRLAVRAADYQPDPAIETDQHPLSPGPSPQGRGEEVEAGAADWVATQVSDLGIPEAAKSALTAAGLKSVEDVLAYGAEHGSLTPIKGIGESSEKAIQEAIAKIAQIEA